MNCGCCQLQNEKSKNIGLEIFSWNESKFCTTSVLIYDKISNEGILFNGQFEYYYAEKIVSYCKERNIKIMLLFITHNDPDYYFGSKAITDNFPGVEVFTHPQTRYLITSSLEDKLSQWNYRNEDVVIPKSISKNQLQTINLNFYFYADKNNIIVHCPDLRMLILSNLLSVEMHPWMADTDKNSGLEDWVDTLVKTLAFEADMVIPGHMLRLENYDLCKSNIKVMVEYLKNFYVGYKTFNSYNRLYQYMSEEFPGFGKRENLELGCKYFFGNVKWKQYKYFPAIGNKVYMDFENRKFYLDFVTDELIYFEDLNTPNINGQAEYRVIQTDANTFAVSWFYPKVQMSVLLIQNWETLEVWAYIHTPNNPEGFQEKGVLELIN